MFHLEFEEVKALLNGKYRAPTCTDCEGKGWDLYDNEGELCRTPKAPMPENLTAEEAEDWEWENERTKYGCETCSGLGVNIIYL